MQSLQEGEFLSTDFGGYYLLACMHHKPRAARGDPPAFVGAHEFILEFANQVTRVSLDTEMPFRRVCCRASFRMA